MRLGIRRTFDSVVQKTLSRLNSEMPHELHVLSELAGQESLIGEEGE